MLLFAPQLPAQVKPTPLSPAASPHLPHRDSLFLSVLCRCLSLGRAVELLLTTEGNGFEFVPATAALDFIDETIRGEGWQQED
jgi:hypothetical protein